MLHEIHQNSEQKLSKSALIAGAFLVGSMVEIGRSTHASRQENVSGLMSYPSDKGPSFIFLRGCGENYAAQAPLHARKLAKYGSLHFEYQTQGKHNQDFIDQNIIDACKIDGDRDRVLIGTSMGLMNAMRSLTNPRVCEAIGENRLRAIISRSGMTSRVDLQPGMRRAAAISARLSRSALVGDLWRMHRLRRASREHEFSEQSSIDEARLHHESSAYMPFQLVTSQHKAIHRSQPWDSESHRHIVEMNPDIELYKITAEYDAVVDWHHATKSLEQSFKRPVEVIIDSRRPAGSHADDLEFPEPLAECMEAYGHANPRATSSSRQLFHYQQGRRVA